MHYLVRILTEADNKEMAIANAFSYADDLVEMGDFDWLTLVQNAGMRAVKDINYRLRQVRSGYNRLWTTTEKNLIVA